MLQTTEGGTRDCLPQGQHRQACTAGRDAALSRMVGTASNITIIHSDCTRHTACGISASRGYRLRMSEMVGPSVDIHALRTTLVISISPNSSSVLTLVGLLSLNFASASSSPSCGSKMTLQSIKFLVRLCNFRHRVPM